MDFRSGLSIRCSSRFPVNYLRHAWSPTLGVEYYWQTFRPLFLLFIPSFQRLTTMRRFLSTKPITRANAAGKAHLEWSVAVASLIASDLLLISSDWLSCARPASVRMDRTIAISFCRVCREMPCASRDMLPPTPNVIAIFSGERGMHGGAKAAPR